MPAEVLLFYIEADLSGEEKIYLGARRRGLRSRFPPRQAGPDTYIRVVDGGIRDNHLQSVLNDHPSAQA